MSAVVFPTGYFIRVRCTAGYDKGQIVNMRREIAIQRVNCGTAELVNDSTPSTSDLPEGLDLKYDHSNWHREAERVSREFPNASQPVDAPRKASPKIRYV